MNYMTDIPRFIPNHRFIELERISDLTHGAVFPGDCDCRITVIGQYRISGNVHSCSNRNGQIVIPFLQFFTFQNAEGDMDSLTELTGWLQDGPPLASVDKLSIEWSPSQNKFKTFEIVR